MKTNLEPAPKRARASTDATEEGQGSPSTQAAGGRGSASSVLTAPQGLAPRRARPALEEPTQSWRMVTIDALLAGQRRNHLEEKGIQPQALVKAITTGKREAFFDAVGQRADRALHHIEKYRFNPFTPKLNPSPARPCGPVRGIEELQLALPSLDEPHTIDVARYLHNRVSTAVLEKIRRLGAEFFLDAEDRLQATYEAEGYEVRGSIGSPTSTRFYYLQRGDEEKVVMANIVSHARLAHQVLQLHFGGIEAAQLTMRGDLEAAKAESVARLGAMLAELPAADRKVCFFGARRQVTQQLREAVATLGPDSGLELSAAQTRQVDSFALDSLRLSTPTGELQLIAFRMPNGDLAQGAVQALLGNGVQTLVMCGAGGALRDDAVVGDYLEISHSQRNGEHLPLREDRTLPAPAAGWVKAGAGNVTVDSPLEETHAWLAEARSHSDSVDVESAHVLQGFHEHLKAHPDSDARLVAGLFVSDVVGRHPLEEKITSGDAYQHLGPFVRSVLPQLLGRGTVTVPS